MALDFTRAWRFPIFLLFFLAYTNSNAQLVVENTLTPQELVEQILLGNGVQVSNITFNGIANPPLNSQIGYFNSENSNVPFSEGVIMSSGGVGSAVGPNDECCASGFVDNPNTTSDPDLAALISPITVNDCAVLEFDFIPNGDTLKFNFAFASEEYNEYVCGTVNDVFGFFISGPGINGPYTNDAENIALIPGTDIPVSINTLNNGTVGANGSEENCSDLDPNWTDNAVFFIDNDGNPDTTAIQYDGLTVLLTATAIVQCGEEYHIKLAIADGGDWSFDSGVFLQSGSFTSNSAVQVDLDIPVGVADSTVYEGCSMATIAFIRPSASTLAETAYLEIAGTAVNGLDYSFIPDSVVFPPGIDTVRFEIQAFPDGNIEGQEIVDITLTNIASECSGSVLTSNFYFYINEADPLEVTSFDTSLVDCHDEVQLFPTVSGGYGEYQYEWTTGETSDTITVSPGVTSTISVIVSDTCGAGSINVPFTVEVPVYDPVVVDAGDDITMNVCDSTITFMADVSGGFGEYTYEWTEGNAVIGDAAGLQYNATNSTQIFVQVTDDCGSTGMDDIIINIPPNEVVLSHPGDYIASTCLEEILMPAVSEGGIGQITYEWFVNGVSRLSTTQTYFEYEPQWGQNVVLVATDQCENADEIQITVEFDFPEVTLQTSLDTAICEEGVAVLFGEAIAGSGNYKYQWSELDTNSQLLIIEPEETASYLFTATDTCGTTASKLVEVEVRNVIARFEHEPYDYYGVNIINHSVAQSPTYYWDFGDNRSSEEKDPVHVYYDDQPHTIVLSVTDDIGCVDTARVHVIPPMEIYIPNTFTPNGDGINDRFQVVGTYIEEFHLVIYDRWGDKVFESTDVDEPWNGSHMGNDYFVQPGTYQFKLRVKGPKEDDIIEKTGYLNLIR